MPIKDSLLFPNDVHRGKHAWWRARLREIPINDIPEEEIQNHLDRMPERYWGIVTEPELLWSLKSIHLFLQRSKHVQPGQTCLTMDWRHMPEKGFTQVLICSWDRLGLLAKIAGTLSGLGINFLHAHAFTRSDRVVVDMFEVRLQSSDGIVPSAIMQQASFLLEGALNQSSSPEPARAWQRLCILENETVRMTPRLRFENQRCPGQTVMTVETADRLGLLQDILQALEDCGLSIAAAQINTDDEVATDVFYFVEEDGEKIKDAHRFDQIRQAVIWAIEGDAMGRLLPASLER